MSRFFEVVGMVSIGAVVAGGVTALVLTSEDDDAVTATAGTGQITPDVNETASETAQVTRAATSNVDLGAADRIHSIISGTEDVIDSQEPLTPEQEQVVTFFEKIARDRNAEGGTDNAAVNFDNLTIDRLNVKYYYSTAARYSDLDVPRLMGEQQVLVQANICDQPSIRALIANYDLEYTYRFISSDFRYIGEVAGDVAACDS